MVDWPTAVVVIVVIVAPYLGAALIVWARRR